MRMSVVTGQPRWTGLAGYHKTQKTPYLGVSHFK